VVGGGAVGTKVWDKDWGLRATGLRKRPTTAGRVERDRKQDHDC